MWLSPNGSTEKVSEIFSSPPTENYIPAPSANFSEVPISPLPCGCNPRFISDLFDANSLCVSFDSNSVVVNNIPVEPDFSSIDSIFACHADKLTNYRDSSCLSTVSDKKYLSQLSSAVTNDLRENNDGVIFDNVDDWSLDCFPEVARLGDAKLVSLSADITNDRSLDCHAIVSEFRPTVLPKSDVPISLNDYSSDSKIISAHVEPSFVSAYVPSNTSLIGASTGPRVDCYDHACLQKSRPSAWISCPGPDGMTVAKAVIENDDGLSFAKPSIENARLTSAVSDENVLANTTSLSDDSVICNSLPITETCGKSLFATDLVRQDRQLGSTIRLDVDHEQSRVREPDSVTSSIYLFINPN